MKSFPAVRHAVAVILEHLTPLIASTLQTLKEGGELSLKEDDFDLGGLEYEPAPVPKSEPEPPTEEGLKKEREEQKNLFIIHHTIEYARTGMKPHEAKEQAYQLYETLKEHLGKERRLGRQVCF